MSNSPLSNLAKICSVVLGLLNEKRQTKTYGDVNKWIFETFTVDVSKRNITTNLHISTKKHNCHILLSSYRRMAIDNIINSSIIASDTTQTNWAGWRGCTQHPPLTKHNQISLSSIFKMQLLFTTLQHIPMTTIDPWNACMQHYR